MYKNWGGLRKANNVRNCINIYKLLWIVWSKLSSRLLMDQWIQICFYQRGRKIIYLLNSHKDSAFVSKKVANTKLITFMQTTLKPLQINSVLYYLPSFLIIFQKKRNLDKCYSFYIPLKWKMRKFMNMKSSLESLLMKFKTRIKST